MAENLAPASCTEQEYDMARKAGLLVVTTRDERAIHAFAEAVRAAHSAPACRAALEELADLMQGVIDGTYVPDSFTLQPARNALAATGSTA